MQEKLGCQCVGLRREEGPQHFEATIENADNFIFLKHTPCKSVDMMVQ